MRYEYTEDCVTGIPKVDEEHKKFFEYVNAGMEALKQPEEEAVIMARSLLKKLEDYAVSHLNHEEDYMRQTKDAELFVQIRAHENFRTKLSEWQGKENLTCEDMKEIFDFMARWLYNHIISLDTLIGKAKLSQRFTMTKEFYTGIPFVDQEHATLFEIIGRVYDIINNDLLYDKYDPIMEVLAELKDYTVKHFSDEEEYMAKIEYKDLDKQKAAHDAFVARLGEVGVFDEAEIDENQTEYLESLVTFLNEWLINHILRMDRKIPVKEV